MARKVHTGTWPASMLFNLLNGYIRDKRMSPFSSCDKYGLIENGGFLNLKAFGLSSQNIEVKFFRQPPLRKLKGKSKIQFLLEDSDLFIKMGERTLTFYFLDKESDIEQSPGLNHILDPDSVEKVDFSLHEPESYIQDVLHKSLVRLQRAKKKLEIVGVHVTLALQGESLRLKLEIKLQDSIKF